MYHYINCKSLGGSGTKDYSDDSDEFQYSDSDCKDEASNCHEVLQRSVCFEHGDKCKQVI